jgi:hypothetical protein
MNDPKLDLLVKEKMQKYVPARPIQVLHCGMIIFASIIIGVLSLPTGQDAGAAPAGPEAWLGFYLAVAGLVLYAAWTRLRSDKARKEAQAELLAASDKTKRKR